MIGAGIAVLWLGYAVAFWGGTFLKGTPLGFTTVVWPGKLAAASAPAAKPAAKKG